MFGGNQNIVLYTEPPVQRLNELTLEQEKSTRSSIEEFLTHSDDIFEEISAVENVYCIRGGYLHALLVHCVNWNAKTECCLVLDMYHASNKQDFFDELSVYESEAINYQSEYESLGRVIFDRWKKQVRNSSDKILVTED